MRDAERSFVDKVGQHYWTVHGVPYGGGCVLGWLMICDPPEQKVSEICELLDVNRVEADTIIEQMTLANVYVRTPIPGQDDYFVRMNDDAWPKAVGHTFANWPKFHAVMEYGVQALADESPERMRRLSNLEELFRYLVTEMPAMMERYHQLELVEGRAG